MTEERPFLRLTGVSKRFGGVHALIDVDWEVRRGEVHCLVGENGCGKSTLIKAVAGVHPPIVRRDRDRRRSRCCRSTRRKAKALGIQVIFQDLSLFPNLTVAENIAIEATMGAALRPVRPGGDAPGARPRCCARLDFPLDLDAQVADLPVAERQITAIARGLAARGAADLHGRAHRLADPRRGRPAARHRRAAEGRRHRRGLRLAPARRDRAGRRARHRHARRPQGRHLAGRRGRPAAHRQPDDRPRHRARRRRPRHERAPSRCSTSTGCRAAASSPTSASRCTAARCSASSACSAPAAPSSPSPSSA